jgi:hypothetical protein
MRTVPLNTSARVTLNASGNGQASVGPANLRERWRVANVAITTAQVVGTVVNDAQCQIFYGSTNNLGDLIDSTLTGSTGDSTDAAASVGDIHNGQVITAVWTTGDAGAVAVISIFGTKTIP